MSVIITGRKSPDYRPGWGGDQQRLLRDIDRRIEEAMVATQTAQWPNSVSIGAPLMEVRALVRKALNEPS